MQGENVSWRFSWYFRFEIRVKLEDNEFTGGRVKGHAHWKTIEEES